uniref:Uncharacterized protein n=1 Tax=Cacopsylla melanoneura TaxID=428564 RepID=A0A8D8XUI1_9HEMI
MKFLLHSILTVTSLLLFSEHVLSTPLPRPQHAQVHVDLIDSIFQIPIQTINAVGTLLKNVHTAKKNFLAPNGFNGGGGGGLSINVHVGHPMDSSEMGDLFPNYKPSSSYPSKKPASNKPASGYPTKKPLGFPTKPPSSYPASSEATPAGFPDYRPPSDFSPVFPESSSVRPVSGVVTPELNYPEQPQGPVEGAYPPASPSVPPPPPSDTPTSGVYNPDATFPDLQLSSSVAPPSYRSTTKLVPQSPPSRQPSNDRVPPAPAVQPPYRPSPPTGSPGGGVQPLSLDAGSGVNLLEKESTKQKNFKDYVAKKLAEKNLQDNRISHTF